MSAISTLKTLQNAAVAVASAAKYIGAANIELGKVVAPALGAAVVSIPRHFSKTLNTARTAETSRERQHAAAVFGIGVACIAGLSVATFAHFSSKRRKSRAFKEQKRQIKAALAREKKIDEALSKAVAMRPASALLDEAVPEHLEFAEESGCFAILTYEPDVALDDPSAYRDVYVGSSQNMIEAVRTQLDGKGNLYVHADMSYKLPVYVAFFPCDAGKMPARKEELISVLGASHSYNKPAVQNADDSESGD